MSKKIDNINVTVPELVGRYAWVLSEDIEWNDPLYEKLKKELGVGYLTGTLKAGAKGDKAWLDLVQQEAATVVDSYEEAKGLVSTIKKSFIAANEGTDGFELDPNKAKVSFKIRDDGKYVVSVIPRRLLEQVFPNLEFAPSKWLPGTPGG